MLTCIPDYIRIACMQISPFYSKLNKRGEGVNKKSTFYTLAKRLKIVDHPLPHPKKSIYHKLALKKEDGISVSSFSTLCSFNIPYFSDNSL